MQTRHINESGRAPRLLVALVPVLLAATIVRPAVGDEGRGGEALYREMCARCHGASGEGTPEDYPHELRGDRSIAQLARLIGKTMPEDDPGTCVGADAEKVAAYIHGAFYSKAAQARNAPARVELSRLTVRQYRNAVADLIGSFREPGRPDDRRGLRGEYFASRRFRDRERTIERVDPEVRFDFGVSSPDPEKLEADQFSIRWQGTVLAPETGEYELIVRTEHATRLWFNDMERPLIDATVKSGDDDEYRASVFLLSGRSYPIRLEFSKAKQGVDDSKKNKPKPPPARASIVLEWKLPHRVAEVIPARHLSPGDAPPTFVVQAAFPPDDRSIGYERGTSISKAWDQATTDAAIEVAAHVAANLDELAGVRSDVPDRADRLREFCRRFAERAFRRPLADGLRTLYVDRQFEGADDEDLDAAVKRVVLLVLKSPRFLYREAGRDVPDAHDIASRLSFGLWDSLPDRALLDAAASGALSDPEQVARQAERMVDDPRTRDKIREFLHQWLKVDQVPDVSKDPEAFPGFDNAIASDLRTSLDLFLDDVVWGDSSDFRQILLSGDLYLNGRLSQFYGADLPPDSPFQKISSGAGERAGILTHPYLMAAFAYTSTSSPIHRGVFLARSVLGRSLRPPPEAASPLPPDLHPSLSTRERTALQTSPASCTTCHSMINPLGFSLENYDAVGRFRTEEKGKSIDASGSYQARSGETVSFRGARELATFLAGCEETHDAFVEQLFHHLVKQPIRAFGPHTLDDLRRSFEENGYNIRRLAVEIAARAAATAPADRPTSGD